MPGLQRKHHKSILGNALQIFLCDGALRWFFFFQPQPHTLSLSVAAA